MLRDAPWDSIEQRERDHWTTLAQAAIMATDCAELASRAHAAESQLAAMGEALNRQLRICARLQIDGQQPL
jgi:hypothetical protein